MVRAMWTWLALAAGLIGLCASAFAQPSDFDVLAPECAPDALPAEYLERLRADVLAETNAIRTNAGLERVAAHPLLDKAAQAHAEDMAATAKLSHEGSDGSTTGARALRVGYDFASIAENIAQGQTAVAKAMRSWMGSPGHKANLLQEDARDLGVGFATGEPIQLSANEFVPGCYWVMVLARRL